MEEKDAGQAEHPQLNQGEVRCYVGVGASAGGVEAVSYTHLPRKKLLIAFWTPR